MTRHFSLDFPTVFGDQVVPGNPADGRREATGVIKPDDLGLLGQVLATHCTTYGIRSEEGRGSVAQSLMAHFRRGVTDETELLAILEREDRPLPKYAGRGRAA